MYLDGSGSGSYKAVVQLSVPRPLLLTTWAQFHRLLECFHDMEAGFPQSRDPRGTERETEPERQSRSKGGEC